MLNQWVECGYVLPLQLGEEDDVADDFGAGEHHDEAVDTNAKATSEVYFYALA